MDNLKKQLKSAMYMDCSEAKLYEAVEALLDGQATLKEKAIAKTHLSYCTSCRDKYQLDLAIKKAISTKVGVIQAPKDVFEKIKAEISKSE